MVILRAELKTLTKFIASFDFSLVNAFLTKSNVVGLVA